MGDPVLLWRAPVFFPENPVKEAAVVVPYGLHDAVCGEGGLGQQVYSLLQLLLLQQFLEGVISVFFQKAADIVGRKL